LTPRLHGYLATESAFIPDRQVRCLTRVAGLPRPTKRWFSTRTSSLKLPLRPPHTHRRDDRLSASVPPARRRSSADTQLARSDTHRRPRGGSCGRSRVSTPNSNLS
jgi:hypothetical protein